MSCCLRVGSLILAGLMSAGCVEVIGGGAIHGSGDIVTVDENHEDFDQVEIDSTFNVTITRADAYAISIRVDENVVDHLRVTRDGDTLRLSLESGHSYDDDVTLQADITMPELSRLSLSGASRASASGFNSDDPFDIELSGASSGTVDVSAGDVDCDLSGASNLTMTGSGADLSLRASGASRPNLRDFDVRDVDADLSGASSAVVRATGSLRATLSGASSLDYYGNPALRDINTSGGSSVKSKD